MISYKFKVVMQRKSKGKINDIDIQSFCKQNFFFHGFLFKSIKIKTLFATTVNL